MSFEPQNNLERSLVKAAAEPAHRPQFYQDFLAAEIFVLPHGEMPKIENGILQSGTQLALQHMELEGKTYLPFFSSLVRLQATLQEEREYLRMGVRPFLAMTQGATLLLNLNPGSDYGKEFLPSEIAQLLDGSMFQSPQPYVVKQDTEILIGQPANYPDNLVASLRQLYAKLPKVRAAYLAQYHDPSRDESPGVLVALDVAGDYEKILADSGICVRGISPEYHHLDFVDLQTSSLKDYFLKTKPFYKQSFLRRFL